MNVVLHTTFRFNRRGPHIEAIDAPVQLSGDYVDARVQFFGKGVEHSYKSIQLLDDSVANPPNERGQHAE